MMWYASRSFAALRMTAAGDLRDQREELLDEERNPLRI
jgi:hypothetical protein